MRARRAVLARQSGERSPCPDTRGSSLRALVLDRGRLGALRAMPARVELRNCGTLEAKRMAPIELPRHLLVFEMAFMRGVTRLEYFAGESLHGGRREHLRKLGQVCAAMHTAQSALQVAAEILEQIESDQFAIVRADRVTMARVRNATRLGSRVDDVRLGVDGDPQQHVVNRFTGRTHAGGEREVTRLR